MRPMYTITTASDFGSMCIVCIAECHERCPWLMRYTLRAICTTMYTNIQNSDHSGVKRKKFNVSDTILKLTATDEPIWNAKKLLAMADATNRVPATYGD